MDVLDVLSGDLLKDEHRGGKPAAVYISVIDLKQQNETHTR